MFVYAYQRTLSKRLPETLFRQPFLFGGYPVLIQHRYEYHQTQPEHQTQPSRLLLGLASQSVYNAATLNHLPACIGHTDMDLPSSFNQSFPTMSE